MTDETNLPPDVAEAMNTISNLHPHGVPTVEGLTAYRAIQTIHDYLLRVTAERNEAMSARERAYANRDIALRAGNQADAERDALRARIEAAPLVTMSRADVCAWDMPDSWSGKRVRLVVEPDNG